MARPTLADFRTELYAGDGCWTVFSQAGIRSDRVPPEIAPLVAEAHRRARELAALFERIEEACGYNPDKEC